jgi:hypothetical protein
MFGSDFSSRFGIPEMPAFPFQGADHQGGLFGANAPTQASPGAAGPMPGGPTTSQGGPGSPAAPTPPIMHDPGPGASSPLGGGPLAPGAGPSFGGEGGRPQENMAPAAGLGSPFGGIRL